MITKVNKAIFRHEMLMLTEDVAAACVTVALSGGADSVALLYAMLEVSDVEVKAAHLNHCLRGAESDADEQFCIDLCNRLGVPITTERIDIKAIAEQTGESIELCARNQRYAFLKRVAGECGVIATAHNADDNLETVIFNLARGTGIAGLCGIPPKRDNIVRPLIYCTRAEIEDYLNAKKQDWRTDSTNTDEAYTRNFIRHSISPRLVQLNPSVKQNVSEMCDVLRSDNEFILSSAEELFEEDSLYCDSLAAAPKSVATAAISLACKRELGITPERKTVNAIYKLCLENKGKYNFEGNSFAVIEKGRLCLYKHQKTENFCLPLRDALGKNIGGWEFSLISKAEYDKFDKVNKKLLFSAADCDKISISSCIKNYRGSGEIRIAGRNCTKSIGKLLNECGIPERCKGEAVIIEDGTGTALVCGYAVSERVKIDKTTTKVLLIKRV